MGGKLSCVASTGSQPAPSLKSIHSEVRGHSCTDSVSQEGVCLPLVLVIITWLEKEERCVATFCCFPVNMGALCELSNKLLVDVPMYWLHAAIY